MHIWGLFDDGNGCYRQAVDEYNVNMGGAAHNNINRNWLCLYQSRFSNQHVTQSQSTMGNTRWTG